MTASDLFARVERARLEAMGREVWKGIEREREKKAEQSWALLQERSKWWHGDAREGGR